MGGTTITICRPSDFDFGGLAGSSKSVTVPLLKDIDLSPYKSGRLVVRILSTDADEDPKIDVDLYNTAPIAGDDDHDYRDGSALQNGVSVTQLSSTKNNTVAISSNDITGLAEVGEVRLTATTTTNPPTQFNIRLAVDLALKVD